MVKLAKELGARVYAEVTPHHFTLTEKAVLEHGTLAKMNPPLRTERDRQAIIEGLKNGSIDMIATDHAPHSEEEKARPLQQAPSGIIGLETALGLAITNLVRPGHLSLLQLMEKMSLNPAKLYHLDSGSVEEGKAADLVLFDPEEEWTVGEFASKSSNSPFTGSRLYGKVKYTICDGKIVYQGWRIRPEGETFMKQYTTILFDVDGTLLDFDSAEERGLASVFKEYEESGVCRTADLIGTYRRVNRACGMPMRKVSLRKTISRIPDSAPCLRPMACRRIQTEHNYRENPWFVMPEAGGAGHQDRMTMW